RAAGEGQPPLVEEIAEAVPARHPKEYGSAVRHDPKALLAFEDSVPRSAALSRARRGIEHGAFAAKPYSSPELSSISETLCVSISGFLGRIPLDFSMTCQTGDHLPRGHPAHRLGRHLDLRRPPAAAEDDPFRRHHRLVH